MKKDKMIGNPKEMHKFVMAFWVRALLQQRMKEKNMKRLEMYSMRVNPTLDQFVDTPISQTKADEGNALLARVGLPPGMATRVRG